MTVRLLLNHIEIEAYAILVCVSTYIHKKSYSYASVRLKMSNSIEKGDKQQNQVKQRNRIHSTRLPNLHFLQMTETNRDS